MTNSSDGQERRWVCSPLCDVEVSGRHAQDCRFGDPGKASVILFRQSGKYYTQEEWRVPEGAIGPDNMIKSPDFRRIDGGPVLVESQEPWGYPHLFPADTWTVQTQDEDGQWEDRWTFLNEDEALNRLSIFNMPPHVPAQVLLRPAWQVVAHN